MGRLKLYVYVKNILPNRIYVCSSSINKRLHWFRIPLYRHFAPTVPIMRSEILLISGGIVMITFPYNRNERYMTHPLTRGKKMKTLGTQSLPILCQTYARRWFSFVCSHFITMRTYALYEFALKKEEEKNVHRKKGGRKVINFIPLFQTVKMVNLCIVHY